MHSSDVQKCFNVDFSEGKNIKTLVEFQNNFHKNNRIFTSFSIKQMPKWNKSAGRRVKQNLIPIR
jgi:hypothetical protein